MVVHSTLWLAASYFTYFFSYGIFLPFWSLWLEGVGLPPETIGMLLGAGLIARFLGSLLLAPRVTDPCQLVFALRLLALLSLVTMVAFWLGEASAWLLIVMVGFNLFFSPLVPLTDALAATWQRQFPLDYGRVRLWGSLAFVIGSAATGKLVSAFSYQAILVLMSIGVASMLTGMLFRPSVMPEGKMAEHSNGGWSVWKKLIIGDWRFLACVTLLQGAHAAYYAFSAIYWQGEGYSASVVGYLWSLSVVAEIIVFALSNRLFRRWSARDLLLLSGITGMIRWGLMATSTELSWLVVSQLMHCGSFTVCHLAAMRYISARHGHEVIRLQSVYSAVAMGGGIAIMTMFSGYLYQHIQGQMFWVMALIAAPALFLRPQVVARS